ncbi:MAG: hypothetical protein ACO25K_05690 [Candidatus Fonsibacter ubiquis]
MMKKLCFYNEFHYGDLFHCKGFIKDIASNLNTEIYFSHNLDQSILSDLNIKYLPFNNSICSRWNDFFTKDDIFYVNTWFGCYFKKRNVKLGECTLEFKYNEMYNEIYERINLEYGCNLKLKSIENYFPFVNYSSFDCTKLEKFLQENKQTKILFSNGKVCSGQTDYNGIMSSLIEKCAIKNPEKMFICTSKFDTNIPNIKFTNDITNISSGSLCDLNEISFLSRECKLIVGRNSGPFCYTTTGENIMDPNKTFYAFGKRATDCFYYNMDIDCSFIFEKTVDYGKEVYELYPHISDAILDLVGQIN